MNDRAERTLIIPQKAVKIIKWYLKNYNNLDERIEKRKNKLRDEMMNYYHYTNSNYLKSIHGFGSTLEKTIIAIEEDKVINKYKKWKYLIRKYMRDMDDKENYISYWVVKYTFFDKRNLEFIQEHLNLDKYEFKQEIFFIFYELYQRAIEEKLLRGGEYNVKL